MTAIVLVASTNPVKLQAVEVAFHQAFPGTAFAFQTASVPSGVSIQPDSDRETFQGADNRSRTARSIYPGADYWIGIEGGISPLDNRLLAFAWVVIRDSLRSGCGRTGSFLLPQAVSDLVLKGHELGVADDIVFGRQNSKQEEGAVGLLTHSRMTRQNLYAPAVILALIPFLNPELYPPGDNLPALD